MAQGFELVGHNPLFLRGMNAAPAIYDHYVYVGNRTDGSPQHPHPGVLVVDVANQRARRSWARSGSRTKVSPARPRASSASGRSSAC